MKKITSFLLILILLCTLFSLSGCGEDKTTYSMNIVLEGDTVHVKQITSFKTTEGMEKISFYVPTMAFLKGNNIVLEERKKDAFSEGESFGEFALEEVMIDDENVESSFSGKDKTTLSIFKKIDKPKKISISMTYKIKLPKGTMRMSIGENTVNLGNFYPILMPPDEVEEKATKWQYYSLGDPFYSEVADYEISLTTQKDMIVAASCEENEVKEENGKKTFIYSGKDMRDFAFVASSKFKVEEGKINNISVKYFYHVDEDPSVALDVSKRALETFSKHFGKYSLSHLSVVQNDFFQGGMEYPGLVMISNKANGQMQKEVIAHEIAHQWWYAQVGNNQINFPVLDEGLTEFSTLFFFEENADLGIDPKQFLKMKEESLKTYESIKLILGEDTSIDITKGLTDFSGEFDYYYTIYVKGALFFNEIRECMGEQKFLEALRLYQKNNLNKIANFASIKESFEEVMPGIGEVIDSLTLNKQVFLTT